MVKWIAYATNDRQNAKAAKAYNTPAKNTIKLDEETT